MQLEIFRSLWGERRAWPDVIAETRAAGFTGIEARVPDHLTAARHHASLLAQEAVPYIAITLTGGGVIPRQKASLTDHLDDLAAIFERAVIMRPRFVNVLGGNDRWGITEQADFIGGALDLARRVGIDCVFETHRARILSSPWITQAVLTQCPAEARFTTDISHWVVTCERFLDDPMDDFSAFIERVHHIQARIGYDQGPQVSHPAAPEHARARQFHQTFWEAVWRSQMRRGYPVSTMTPECGPDGYGHTLPFTNLPVADLWEMNRWIGQTEQAHFKQFQAGEHPARQKGM